MTMTMAGGVGGGPGTWNIYTVFAAQGTQGHGLGSLVVTDCGGGDGIKTDLGWLLTLLVRAWGDHLRNQFSRQRHCHRLVYFSTKMAES